MSRDYDANIYQRLTAYYSKFELEFLRDLVKTILGIRDQLHPENGWVRIDHIYKNMLFKYDYLYQIKNPVFWRKDQYRYSLFKKKIRNRLEFLNRREIILLDKGIHFFNKKILFIKEKDDRLIEFLANLEIKILMRE